jgi:alanine-glyoxylate transaminase/serine-glyoxylate transaminase/serine-pyruvate transaminase
LAIVLEEGLDARFARHRMNAQALAAGLKAMGIDYVTAEGHRLPQLNCVSIPEGVDDLAVRKRLLREWNVEIGGGLGDLKGRAWRIGLMGYGSRRESVTLVLSALETCLRDSGIPIEPGAALAASAEVYSGSPAPATA